MPSRSHTETRMDMLLKEAYAQAAQLRRIQNSRHVAPRKLQKSRLSANAPTGVDGEIASDQNNCLWLHINGVWQEFVCGGGGILPPVLTGMGPAMYAVDVYNANFDWGDQIAIAIAVSPGVYEYPLPVGADGDPYHRSRPVWNHTFDKIAFTEIDISHPGSGLSAPFYSRLRVMDRDGSNLITIATRPTTGPTDFDHFEFYAFSYAGDRIAYLTHPASGAYAPVRVANIDGSGTPIELGTGHGLQPPMWQPDDEYVYWQGFTGAGPFGIQRAKSDGSASSELFHEEGNVDQWDLNYAGTEFCAYEYGIDPGLLFVTMDGLTETRLPKTEWPWPNPVAGLGVYWTPDGEWVLIGNQVGLGAPDTSWQEDIIALKRSDLSTYRRFSMGNYADKGDVNANPPYANDAFLDTFSCGEVNGALHVFTQYVNSDTGGSAIAAYPFDDPSAGFWLDDEYLDPFTGESIGGRFYVTGLPHMTNWLTGTFDQ